MFKRVVLGLLLPIAVWSLRPAIAASCLYYEAARHPPEIAWIFAEDAGAVVERCPIMDGAPRYRVVARPKLVRGDVCVVLGDEVDIAKGVLVLGRGITEMALARDGACPPLGDRGYLRVEGVSTGVFREVVTAWSDLLISRENSEYLSASYAHNDQEWVDAFFFELRKDGVRALAYEVGYGESYIDGNYFYYISVVVGVMHYGVCFDFHDGRMRLIGIGPIFYD
ncbi:hypothetical protein [Zavarzinia compransoris]|uniref:Uncharacterized protein n=1 Tax=Zavarzinia compransoris TaxID=1264899 RepID=A0A317DZ15_9PROT|nr:hypothetical protein [Zavarzinia compransoris]PWR19130.1 hypothetical protein DKG75_19435 [Zavarzinia compransoris]